MTDDEITVLEVQETEYGEVLVLESPFDAKDFIKVLPWKTLAEEVEEHGSLRSKAEGRGVAEGAIQAAEDFGFSDTFETHVSWDPQALGYDDGAWTIDRGAFEEARQFFEFCGFDVSVAEGVSV